MALTHMNLLELAKRFNGPAGISIAEELNRVSVVLPKMDFEQVPGGIKKFAARAKLPTIGFRHINQAISQDYSVANRFVESCKIMESNPSIDAQVPVADVALALADEALTHVEAMAQNFDEEFFYGDADVDSAGFDGLFQRIVFGGSQCVNAGAASGNATSMYAVKFGRGHLRGIVPVGKEWLKTKRLGEYLDQDLGILVEGAHVAVNAGMYVANGKAVSQLANIGTVAVGTNAPSSDNLHEFVLAVKGGADIIYTSSFGLRQLQYVLENSLATHLPPGLDKIGAMVYQWGSVPVVVTDAVSAIESIKS